MTDASAPGTSENYAAAVPSKALGVCWIVYGILRLLIALWLANFTPIATVMFGALLSRVADPYSLMNDFHVFYLFAIVLSILCGIFGLLAGFTLLAGARSGRMFAIIAAFLSLSELPVGITLGVYTLWAMPPWRRERA
jgi:hypothetical protein